MFVLINQFFFEIRNSHFLLKRMRQHENYPAFGKLTLNRVHYMEALLLYHLVDLLERLLELDHLLHKSV